MLEITIIEWSFSQNNTVQYQVKFCSTYFTCIWNKVLFPISSLTYM